MKHQKLWQTLNVLCAGISMVGLVVFINAFVTDALSNAAPIAFCTFTISGIVAAGSYAIYGFRLHLYEYRREQERAEYREQIPYLVAAAYGVSRRPSPDRRLDCAADRPPRCVPERLRQLFPRPELDWHVIYTAPPRLRQHRDLRP